MHNNQTDKFLPMQLPTLSEYLCVGGVEWAVDDRNDLVLIVLLVLYFQMLIIALINALLQFITFELLNAQIPSEVAQWDRVTLQGAKNGTQRLMWP